MSNNENKKFETIADLRIRQYFDHFLENTLPDILKNHTNTCPHGGQIGKIKWAVIGGAIVLGILIPSFGKVILEWFR